MLNNIIIGMCGVNFTLFGCEEKILYNVHIVHCTSSYLVGKDFFGTLMKRVNGWGRGEES